MNLLYIEACPRPDGISRTRALADGFLRTFAAAWPAATVTRHDVFSMGLAPIDGPALDAREALIDARSWEYPLFAPARAFAAADAIAVAAPYWDLMFPAMLKVYIEHIFIRELTFRYVNDQPVGLCRARRAVFLTTAGSPVGAHDFGTEYLRATFAMLGVGPLEGIAAEGIDLAGADVDGILAAAQAKAARAAETILAP